MEDLVVDLLLRPAVLPPVHVRAGRALEPAPGAPGRGRARAPRRARARGAGAAPRVRDRTGRESGREWGVGPQATLAPVKTYKIDVYGVRSNSRVAPTCAASEFSNGSDAGCPAGSRIGSGQVQSLVYQTNNPQSQGAMSVFTTREAAEEFARKDPFVVNGVVRSWEVREWDEAVDS